MGQAPGPCLRLVACLVGGYVGRPGQLAPFVPRVSSAVAATWRATRHAETSPQPLHLRVRTRGAHTYDERVGHTARTSRLTGAYAVEPLYLSELGLVSGGETHGSG